MQTNTSPPNHHHHYHHHHHPTNFAVNSSSPLNTTTTTTTNNNNSTVALGGGKRSRGSDGSKSGGKRANSNNNNNNNKSKKKKDAEGPKAAKGLRHFSMKVCRKVEEKGRTTYNEVADELVREFVAERAAEEAASASASASSSSSPFDPRVPVGPGGVGGGGGPSYVGTPGKNDDDGGGKRKRLRGTRSAYDEKNIRRRVYDALNVLMAMDIVSKDKKEIRWRGFPERVGDGATPRVVVEREEEALRRKRTAREREIGRKRECLKDLLVRRVCYENLARRNRRAAEERRRARRPRTTPSEQEEHHDDDDDEENNKHSVSLPFIVVNANHDTEILCKSSKDWTDVMFDFSEPFEINDDNEILRRLGLGRTTADELRRLFPTELIRYCEENNMLDSVILSEREQQYRHHQDPAPYDGLPSRSHGAGRPYDATATTAAPVIVTRHERRRSPHGDDARRRRSPQPPPPPPPTLQDKYYHHHQQQPQPQPQHVVAPPPPQTGAGGGPPPPPPHPTSTSSTPYHHLFPPEPQFYDASPYGYGSGKGSLVPPLTASPPQASSATPTSTNEFFDDVGFGRWP